MTSPPEVIMIRHGRAHCNDTATIAGPACTGLTGAGRRQAEATARRLASPVVTAVHASTTPRALHTAQIIAAALAVPLVLQPGLRVPDPGRAEGQPWPQARAAWPSDPHNATLPLAPGAETWTAYLDRATATLSSLLDDHPGGTLIVVGHTETLTAMLHLLLGVPTLGRLKLSFDHCAASTWQATTEWPGSAVTCQRWTLTRHNDTAHLDHNATPNDDSPL
jgi:2,3-bisphosphoglycerate-dependent phosphoglycerate mutase